MSASTPSAIAAPRASQLLVSQVLVFAFAMSLVLWSAWFVTHLPRLGLAESMSLPIVLGCWVLSAGWMGWKSPRAGVLTYFLSGLLSAAIGVLILGSKIAQPPAAGETASEGLVPSWPLIVAGFLALGSAIGIVGGCLGRALGSRRARAVDDDDLAWRWRFALVTACSLAPLLFVGGLVTSTGSGMAVPDWPNTFGSNMFLYPLGPRAQASLTHLTEQGQTYASIYLEHTHRLFGTLAGLHTIVLLLLALTGRFEKRVRVWAIVLLLVVILQGVLGGFRVRLGNAIPALDDRVLRLIHGVLGQVVLVNAVAIAAFMSPAFRSTRPEALSPSSPDYAPARRLRIFATAALHASLLQLVFGAMYRHWRGGPGANHALWTHAIFSLAVVVLVLMAAFGAMAAAQKYPGVRLLDACVKAGKWMVGVVAVQFMLGWAALFAGGSGPEVQTGIQALVRSTHQANGALLLGLVATVAMLVRALPKRAG